jgi:MinD-like ATPase involved in chromosome partitioning or flagellar assembly
MADQHGDPLWRRFGHEAARPFRSNDDIRAVAESVANVQRPITTGRRLVVAAMRGGAGKSTVAALLATVFARHRRDRVLALDIDPDFGSLPLRLGVRARRTLRDLADAQVMGGSFADVAPYLARAGERLWTLSGTRGRVGDGGLDAELYEAAGIPLTRFFGITIVDCGSGMNSGLSRSALTGAHALILVTPATTDGARSVGRTLDWLIGVGMSDLVARTVVAFTVKDAHHRGSVDVNRAAEILGEIGTGVATLDYDRHIASGAVLDPRRLARATRFTALRIAAEALGRAL